MPGVQPIATEVLHVSPDLVENLQVHASVDKGASLVKILYVVPKGATEDCETPEGSSSLVCHLFRNQDFLEAIDFMMAHMRMPQQGQEVTLRVTGVGCDRAMDILKEKTQFRVKFMDELYSQGHGSYWLLKHVHTAELFYPTDEFDPIYVGDPETSVWKKMGDKMAADLVTVASGNTFPCILAILGSGSAFLKLESDGSMKFIGGTIFCGKLLVGLAKLLVGTNDYNELLSLADKGNRENTDTLVSEIFSNLQNSPYGQYPPNTPIFHFGKAVDRNASLDSFRREDLAASLVSLVVTSILSAVWTAALEHKVCQVFVSGNMCRGKWVREEIHRLKSLYGTSLLDIKLFKTGHAAAVGAMFSEEEKMEFRFLWMFEAGVHGMGTSDGNFHDEATQSVSNISLQALETMAVLT